MYSPFRFGFFVCVISSLLIRSQERLFAQQPFPSAEKLKISEAEREQITAQLAQLRKAVGRLKQGKREVRRLAIAGVNLFPRIFLKVNNF